MRKLKHVGRGLKTEREFHKEIIAEHKRSIKSNWSGSYCGGGLPLSIGMIYFGTPRRKERKEKP